MFLKERYPNKWHPVTEYNLLTRYLLGTKQNHHGVPLSKCKITITGPTIKNPDSDGDPYEIYARDTTHLTMNKILK